MSFRRLVVFYESFCVKPAVMVKNGSHIQGADFFDELRTVVILSCHIVIQKVVTQIVEHGAMQVFQ